MSNTDEQLIARVQQKRDTRAFEQLVLRYQSQVRTWALRLNRNDHASADDLAQEAFIKAYAALPNFRGTAKFSVWLYRIVFNTAASKWRKNELNWASLEESDSVEGYCEQTDAMRKGDLKWAMAQLTEAQQIAISLCFEDGFTHDEACQIMNIPLGTLKTHINRGKSKLQSLLTAWRSEYAS